MTQRKSKPKLRKGEQVWYAASKNGKLIYGVFEKTREHAEIFTDHDEEVVEIIVRLA